MSEFNQARREGKIKFGYDFDTLAEVTHLWGLSATKLPYQVAFKVPGRENAICVLLSEKGGDGWSNIPHRGMNVDARGWHEIVRIDEVNSDSEKSVQRVNAELARPLERYVFWHETRRGESFYKFYGVFRLDVSHTKNLQSAGTNMCVYRKISDVGTCPAYVAPVTTLATAAFRGLQGMTLTAQLLDEVAFEGTGEKERSGTFKVWPGQKLTIESVSASGQTAVCSTADADLLSQFADLRVVRFLVPKRDLELGYFTWDGRMDH